MTKVKALRLGVDAHCMCTNVVNYSTLSSDVCVRTDIMPTYPICPVDDAQVTQPSALY